MSNENETPPVTLELFPGGPRRRLKSCVEAWPGCVEGEYNPYCCRFPKSCSCDIYSADRIRDDQLEDIPVRVSAPVADDGCSATQRGTGQPHDCTSCQPAGEQHTGTLNLTGEGNGDRDPILEAALIAAGHTTLHGHRNEQMTAAIAAVTPLIRQQVAEEIEVAIAARRSEITPGRPGYVYLTEAIGIVEKVGGKA